MHKHLPYFSTSNERRVSKQQALKQQVPAQESIEWKFQSALFCEKCRSITVASFVLFFFRQITVFTLYVALFSTDFNRFRGNLAVTCSGPSLSQKMFREFAKPDETEGSPVNFVRHCATFGINFCLQKAQSSNLKYFAANWAAKLSEILG